MANINAKIDENYEKVLLAITDDANQETRPLLVEPVLGELEIDLELKPSITSVNVSGKIDQNFEHTSLAVDETTGEPKPLKVDATSGRLVIDITL